MIIIGCDYHPGFQQIAFVDTDTGELQERRRIWNHRGGFRGLLGLSLEKHDWPFSTRVIVIG
jgi:hypothetical protein